MKSGQLIQTVDKTNSMIKLNITHSVLNIKVPEVRFDLFDTIASIKNSCEKKLGTSSGNMELILQDACIYKTQGFNQIDGHTVAAMNEDDRTLGFYCPQEGYTIHVIDLDPHSITKELEDLSQVEKYVMSEDDYNKLPTNFRKFKENLIKAHPELQKPEKVQMGEDFMMEEAMQFVVGNRCKLIELGHRGKIKYVGQVPEIGEGWYIGVQLDEPFGKHNGTFSVKDSQYFQCPTNYGLFVRPDKVEMGDFPELDLDDEI